METENEHPLAVATTATRAAAAAAAAAAATTTTVPGVIILRSKAAQIAGTISLIAIGTVAAPR